MKNYKIYQIILILTPFVFAFAFGLDAYIPVIPQMAKIFDTTPALVQMTLSLFLLITGLGQLFVGPLSDQWGRKPILYASALLFALGSLACAFSPSISFLIAARCVAAVGACGMLVTSFALVRDLYSNEETAKLYSFLNGAIGISPTFAPIIGGFLAVRFGWQSVFVLLTLIGLMAMLVTRLFVTETHPVEYRVKVNKTLLPRYLSIVRNKTLLIYSLISGFGESVFFCFFSISPFIIIGLHGIPTDEFGYYFALFGSVIALGGFASGKLVEKLGTDKTIALGIGLMFLGGVSMLSCYFAFLCSLAGFLIPMAIACTGAMFLIGCSASKAMAPFQTIAGTASAAFGAIQFTLSSLVGSLLMLFPTNSTLPYASIIILMSILSVVFWIYVRRTERTIS